MGRYASRCKLVMAPKRPHDLNQWEKLMVDIATGVLARIRSEHAASDGDETCEVPAAGTPQPTRSKSRIAPNRTPPWKASASRSGASSRRASSRLQSLRLRLTSDAPPAKKVNHEMAPE